MADHPAALAAADLSAPHDAKPSSNSSSSSSADSAALANTSHAAAAAAAALQRRKTPVPNRNIPAFLNKLYSMVSDSSTDKYIHWNADGTSFIVTNQDELAHDVLPRFFKHNNFTSFIRQLNMYGFHKIPNLQQGSLLSSNRPESLEFSNANFQRDKPDLLCFVIRRKGTQSEELVKDGTVDMNSVIYEIAAIKRHQLTISADLQKIQRENEAAWAESLQLRERYAKQQDTIEKILRFLASVFSSRKKTAVQSASKRRRLELTDGPVATSPELDAAASLFSNIITAGADPSIPPSFAFADHSALNTPFVPNQSFNNTSNTQPILKIMDLPDSNTNNAATMALYANAFPSITAAMGPAQAANAMNGTQIATSAQPATASQLLSQLAGARTNLNGVMHEAKEVEDDIDLLQDRLYDISSIVGLNMLPESHNDWNVDNFVANPTLVASGTDEDHATLVALINNHTAPATATLAPNMTSIAPLMTNVAGLAPPVVLPGVKQPVPPQMTLPGLKLQHAPLLTSSGHHPAVDSPTATQLLASLVNPPPPSTQPTTSPTTASSTSPHFDDLDDYIVMPSPFDHNQKHLANSLLRDSEEIDQANFDEFFNT